MVAQSPQRALSVLAQHPREVRLEIERRRLERSLYAFVQAAWHVVEPAKPFCAGWHIEAICEHLEAVTRGDVAELVVNMPPRHGKSLLVAVFWPAWVWTFAPAKRFIFASYAQTLSSRDARKFRRVISSAWYQRLWGHRYRVTSDQNTKLEIENDATGHRIATSVGASGTGKGGDFVAVDDANKVGSAESRAIRERTNAWWFEEMGTREDTGEGVVARVIVQQRVHHDDLSGAVLRGASNDDSELADENAPPPPVHLCLPAEFEGDSSPNGLGFVDPREEEGDLLWPAGCDAKRLARIKRALRSPYAIAGQLQQRPVPRGGGIIKADWIKTFQEAPTSFERALISVDASHGSTSSTASHHVFGLIVAKGADVYVLELERFRGGFPELLARLKAFIDNARALLSRLGLSITLEVLVENKASGRSAVQTLAREIPGLIPVEPGSRDKETRLDAVSIRYEAGNVRIPAYASWREVFVFEHTAFPRAGSDDIVDMMSQGLERLTQTRRKVTVSVLGGRRR